jgi:hypothetical protein
MRVCLGRHGRTVGMVLRGLEGRRNECLPWIGVGKAAAAVVLGVQSMLAKVTHWYRNLCFQMFLFFLLGACECCCCCFCCGICVTGGTLSGWKAACAGVLF